MKCQFCDQGQEAEHTCGKLYKVVNSKCSCVAHQRCMQYSSNLTQFRIETFGGFRIEDVEKEVKRGKKLRCHICKKKGATAGCSYEKCNKTYHFPCAFKSQNAIVKRFAKSSSQDINQMVAIFCTFCGVSHKIMYMRDSNLVDADFDDERSLHGIVRNMEDETADDSMESTESVSLLPRSRQSIDKTDLSGFRLLTPDVNEDAVDCNAILTSGTCRSTNMHTTELCTALYVSENPVGSNFVHTSNRGAKTDDVRLDASVRQTTATAIGAANGTDVLANDQANGTVPPSGTVVTRAVTSPTETANTVASLVPRVTDDVTFGAKSFGSTGENDNSFGFSVDNLSQSQSRRERLSLRSTQKRRREKQVNGEIAYSRGLPRTDEIIDTSAVPADSGHDRMPGMETSEEIDFDSLPDPFGIPKLNSSTEYHQNVSTSRERRKNSKLDHSQRLITSMLSSAKKNKKFEIENLSPVEGQKEILPAAKSSKISNTDEAFQLLYPNDDVVPNVLLRGQSISDAGDAEVHDLHPTYSFNELGCSQETRSVQGTSQKVLAMAGNKTNAVPPFENSDLGNSLLEGLDTNARDVFHCMQVEDARKHSDGDDDDDDAFEVLNSNIIESSAFTFRTENEMEIDQVCALCIPVSEKPLNEKASCVLLRYAICKLGLVEDNVFTWQMTDCKKIEIVNTLLKCSEYLRDQNDKKLMETLFKTSQFDTVENSQDGDSSKDECIEAITLTIQENFKIATQKYGEFMGEFFSAPNLDLQAAFIVLNRLNDFAFLARSNLPRNRIHVCSDDTKFTIPVNISDAQTRMISDLEYKNLKWCLENWFDHSTAVFYPAERELRLKNCLSLSECIGSHFMQHLVSGGNTYFVFVYRTDPDLINYRLFVCKLLAFVKEELVTLNHDVCILFDVGGETGIACLADVVTPNLSEILAGCYFEVRVYAGVNPNYSPVSCLLMHLSLHNQ